MRLDTLQRVDLYCTSCAAFDGGISQHKLILIPGITSAEYVIFGSLECSHCSKRYPIIDGVPCLSESVPGNQDLTGQYLDAHYGAINTRYWREMKAAAGTGTCLDVGCSVGRYTFECAQNGFAVGMDVNFEQIRLAAEFQRTGQIAYTRRRRALRDELKKSAFKPAGKTLFILADIHNPPFKMESFDFISALNVIDSVKNPLTALGQMDAMCKPNGTLLLSSPYSWNADVSAEFLETAEIGPHEFMKQLLTGRQVPECDFNYRFLADNTGIQWRLRRQDSLEFVYTVDLLLAEKLQSS